MKFSEVSAVSGADSDTDGRAVLVADLDDDGDDDIVLTTLQRRRFHVLRNERTGGQEHGFIKIRLRAKGGNTRGIGALVTVAAGARTTVRPRMAGGGFASQRGEWMTFGTGTAKTVDVQILWPGGERRTYPGLSAGTRYLFTQGTARPTVVAAKTFALPDPPPPGLAGIVAEPGEVVGALPLTDGAGAKVAWAPPTGDGRATVLHLWATWCKSCRKELPDLAKLAAGLAKSHPGVRVQTVSMEPGEHKAVASFLRDQGIDLPSHVGDPEEMTGLVSADGILLPTTLIIDSQGRLTEGLQSTLAVVGIPAALARLR